MARYSEDSNYWRLAASRRRFLGIAGGTLSGDVDINDNTGLGIGNPSLYDLYSVILHEAGVALSVPENQTPGTVMDVRYQAGRAAQ